MILAGDVGGTKVHLALYNMAGERLRLVRERKYPAQGFPALDAVVGAFLADDKRVEISAACFGCPGPVRDGRLKLTNLPWTLDERKLEKLLEIKRVLLINDLEATGYGIPELAADKIVTLQRGNTTAAGHRGLVAAGTGLGEALLIWDGVRHRPIASEGGHGDFAARTDREVALLNYLRCRLGGRVSWERVVSGFGIQNTYAYLRYVERMDEPAWLSERMAAEDANAVIGQCAEDESSKICIETMQIFAAAYGAEAGNLALKVLATGGVYLGGGIAPKSLNILRNGGFMQSFLDKGRLSSLLVSIPVRVILDQSCALLGAAAYAAARTSPQA